MKRLLARIVAVGFGLLWGFFVAFNVVFSDIGPSGMVSIVVFVLVAYAGLGLAFGVVGPHTSTRWTPWLAVPGALFALLMLSDNPARITYTLAVVAAVVGGTLLGTFAGTAARRLIEAWLQSRHAGNGPTAPAGL